MKDLVLDGFVESFCTNHNLLSLTNDVQFEAFCVFSLLRKYHQVEVHDVDELVSGGGGDGGLDAIIILINGTIAQTIEDVVYFAEKLKRIEVEFVFVQAKSGTSFEASKIGSFLYGVEQFFNSDASLKFRPEIEELRKVKDYVYRLSIEMDENPKCYVYYCAAGPWNEDLDPKNRLEDGRRRLTELSLFSSVSVEPIDSEKLKATYREIERRISREIEFQKIAVFPRIDGVDEAYLGLLPGDQFMKLISTDDGMLNRELFYDNVRDFQGDNPVNREIEQTLKDSSGPNRFALLNNGITLVARSVNKQGDRFRISDFQIVNGCQTTHMLFRCKDRMGQDAFVPLKLIVTDNSEIITEVIKATNRQTPVLTEALESLTPFHKDLEDFYVSQHSKLNRNDYLYYERRSKQYLFDRIQQSNIITLTAQTKSFVAMFLNEPHSHPRYYGELLRAYEQRLFLPDHKPAPYYASGLAFYVVEKFISRGDIQRQNKKYKFHLVMLLRILTAGVEVPKLNNNKISDYSLKIIDCLSSDESALKYCKEAESLLVDELSKFGKRSDDISRLKAFTSKLLESVKATFEPSASEEPVPDSVETGTIRFYDDWKEFGFIERDNGGDMYVHRKGLFKVPWQLRIAGTRVKYDVIDGYKGPMATNVRLIKKSD
jgi:cold shock CspA family protein